MHRHVEGDKEMKRLLTLALALLAGCSTYKGGRVVDGTNLEIGLAIPGTEGMLTIDALSYTAGLKVCGADKTVISVTNFVSETNSYFGVVKTQRESWMAATITPCDPCGQLAEISTTNDVQEAAAVRTK